MEFSYHNLNIFVFQKIKPLAINACARPQPLKGSFCRTPYRSLKKPYYRNAQVR